MSARAGSAAFALVGPLLEVGVGPALLTDGFAAGDAWAGATALRALGALVIVAGLLVLPWCFLRIADDGGGSPSPALPTSRLVVRGPYRVVRHPMYVVTTAIIVGEGLLLARPVLLGAAAAYLVTTATLALRREDRLLRERFGAAHDEYAARVPAFVPRLRR